MSASDTDILQQLQSLKPTGMPSYTPPDTSALDSDIATQKQTAAGAESTMEAADIGKSNLAAQTAGQLEQGDAQMQALFQQYPARQVAYGAAMSAAPIVGLLAALGGKAAGISGQGMLGALGGMMEGLNAGAEDKYQEQLAKWKQELQTLKDRNAEQLEVYKVMLEAYSGRADAAQKARDFALAATKDDMSQKESEVKNSIELFKARVSATAQADKITLLMENAALKAKAEALGATPAAMQLDAALNDAGITLQGASRGTKAYFARLDNEMQQHPGEDAKSVAEHLRTAQIGTAEAKKEGATAATIVGRTSVGENELIAMAPSAIKASDALPRGEWLPVNQAIQKVQAGSSDVRLKELTQRTNAILNAYDVVAARGGTDAKKRDENRQNLLTADSPAAYRKAIEVMEDEARLAKGAGRQAEKEAASGGSGPKDGDKSTSKSGKPIVYRNGQWEYQ
jgi:hypothetical protein